MIGKDDAKDGWTAMTIAKMDYGENDWVDE